MARTGGGMNAVARRTALLLCTAACVAGQPEWVTIGPVNGTTSEAGGGAEFTVVLSNVQPDADVVVTLTSGDASEVVFAETQTQNLALTFTPGTFNVPQPVVVVGGDDLVADGTQTSTITSVARGSTNGYNGRTGTPRLVQNLDDDVAGLGVSYPPNPTVDEAGTLSVVFTVVLTSQPTATVPVGIAPAASDEIALNITQAVFTVGNWMVPQGVLVRGVDDTFADANTATAVTFDLSGAAGAENTYAAVDTSGDAFQVTNVDDDEAGVFVTPPTAKMGSAGLVEDDPLNPGSPGVSVVTVKLTSEPIGGVSVVLTLTSSDTTEGVVAPTTLTFAGTSGRPWNVLQTVELTGVNDDVDDGDIEWVLATAVASADLGYNGTDVDEVSALTRDDDTADVLITPTANIVTDEAGATAVLSYRLTSQPVVDVVIDIAVDDASEAKVSTNALTFTTAPGAYSTPQMVTLTGVDDRVQDGDVAFRVTSQIATTDAAYAGVAIPDVLGTNRDDSDRAGYDVLGGTGDVDERGALSRLVRVRLTSEPSHPVAIGLTVSDAAELRTDKASVTFTPTDYSVYQSIMLRGVDDLRSDGDTTVLLTFSRAETEDDVYRSLSPPVPIALRNLDNDVARVFFDFVPGTVKVLREDDPAGTAQQFIVRLGSEPDHEVTVAITARGDVPTPATDTALITPSVVRFDSVNWSVAQTIAIAAVNDKYDDGNQMLDLTLTTTSDDADYHTMVPVVVAAALQTVDDDTADVLLRRDPTAPTTAGDLTLPGLTEGDAASFEVILATKPTSVVSIAVEALPVSACSVNVSNLVFTPTDWNEGHVVQVMAFDDFVDDATQQCTAKLTEVVSADTNYAAVSAMVATYVDVLNDDTAGVTSELVTAAVTTEAGGQAGVSIMLNTEPVDVVSISIVSSDTSEGKLAADSDIVTFTAATWNLSQTVIVLGQDDPVDDGDVTYTITTVVAAGTADSKYTALTTAAGAGRTTIPLVNIDNDVSRVVVSGASGPTTEAGGEATFTVRLTSQPLSDITMRMSAAPASEGMLSTNVLVFTPGTWDEAATITVTGVDDAVDDGDATYRVVFGTPTTTGADTAYPQLTVDDVLLTNLDNDAAGLTFSTTSLGATGENGDAVVFTCRLDTQPVGDVTVSFASSDATEGNVLPSQVVFGTGPGRVAYNAPQLLTVTGVDDDADDGDIAYAVGITVRSTTDAAYQALVVQPLTVANGDDGKDVAAVKLTAPATRTTSEAASAPAPTYTVVLGSDPTQPVTVSFTSSRADEGIVVAADGRAATSSAGATTAVTFGSGDGSWNVARTLRVVGVDDAIDDGDQTFTITTTVASDDTKYDNQAAALPVASVEFLNVDDDTFAVLVGSLNGTTTGEAGGALSFTVAFATQPTSELLVDITTSRADEAVATPAILTFNAGNWGDVRSVVVTGVDDAADDGDMAFSITVGSPRTASAGVAVPIYPATVLSAVNMDDDTAGVAAVASGSTSEDGDAATITVVLTSRPLGPVTLTAVSSDVSEGVLASAGVLVFTQSTWEIGQTLTVRGVADSIQDGDRVYTITLDAVSTDAHYNASGLAQVQLTNNDRDAVGVVVLVSTGGGTAAAEASVAVSEDGSATGWASLELRTQPAADVVLPLRVGDASEAAITLDPAATQGNSELVTAVTVTFTPATWNLRQTVYIVGVDDLFDDDNVAFSVFIDPPVPNASGGNDALYAALDPIDISVVTVDDDTADVLVSAVMGVLVENAGSQSTATFTVSLTSAPVGSITLTSVSTDATEGVIVSAPLVYDASNYLQGQTVVVAAVDDGMADGNSTFTVNTTITGADGLDTAYALVAVAPAFVTTVDGDAAGVVTTRIQARALESNAADNGGSFSVALLSEPVDGVVVLDVYVSDDALATASPARLLFSKANWTDAQTVVVTAVDNAVDDGDRPVVARVALSVLESDASYEEYAVATGRVLDGEIGSAVWPTVATMDFTVVDDDVAGIAATVLGGITSELGGEAKVVLRLTSQPGLGPVNIVVASSSPEEARVGIIAADNGEPEFSGEFALVTFTAANWNVDQTVYVRGVDDDVADGDAAFIVTAGVLVLDLSDPGANVPQNSVDPYNAVAPMLFEMTNLDDDTAGIAVSAISKFTRERPAGAGDAFFTIVLQSRPLADVAIEMASSDTTEAMLSRARVAFTPDTWNTPQVVMLYGVNDDVADGPQTYFVIFSPAASMDPAYNDTQLAPLRNVNADDGDEVGVFVRPLENNPMYPLVRTFSTGAIVTNESGSGVAIAIGLTSEPTAEVVVGVAVTDATEAALTLAGRDVRSRKLELRFAPEAWRVAQTVVVRGVEDYVVDGDAFYLFVVEYVTSGDAAYARMRPPATAMVNRDVDSYGVRLASVLPTTTEARAGTNITARLRTRPEADVVVYFAVSHATEGAIVGRRSLQFAPDTWNTSQTIAVRGRPDGVKDGDQLYYLYVASTESTDKGYATLGGAVEPAGGSVSPWAIAIPLANEDIDILDECVDMCPTCANGGCNDTARFNCSDPSLLAADVADWVCACLPPAVGSAVGAEAVCSLDECRRDLDCATCGGDRFCATNTGSGTSCVDPNTSPLSLGDWYCSFTASPATGQPETGGPTTGYPTTGNPTTGDPTTGIPATGVPTTGQPTTGIPATGVPAAGGSPTTASPAALSTGEPTTGEPSTADPAVARLVTGVPTTGKPTTGVPTTGRPTTGRPTTGAPPPPQSPMTPLPGTPSPVAPPTPPTTGVAVRWCTLDSQCNVGGACDAATGRCQCGTGYGNLLLPSGAVEHLCYPLSVGGADPAARALRSVVFTLAYPAASCARFKGNAAARARLVDVTAQFLGREITAHSVTCGSVHASFAAEMTADDAAVKASRLPLLASVIKDTPSIAGILGDSDLTESTVALLPPSGRECEVADTRVAAVVDTTSNTTVCAALECNRGYVKVSDSRGVPVCVLYTPPSPVTCLVDSDCSPTSGQRCGALKLCEDVLPTPQPTVVADADESWWTDTKIIAFAAGGGAILLCVIIAVTYYCVTQKKEEEEERAQLQKVTHPTEPTFMSSVMKSQVSKHTAATAPEEFEDDRAYSEDEVVGAHDVVPRRTPTPAGAWVDNGDDNMSPASTMEGGAHASMVARCASPHLSGQQATWSRHVVPTPQASVKAMASPAMSPRIAYSRSPSRAPALPLNTPTRGMTYSPALRVSPFPTARAPSIPPPASPYTAPAVRAHPASQQVHAQVFNPLGFDDVMYSMAAPADDVSVWEDGDMCV